MADRPTSSGESFGVNDPDREHRLGEVLAIYFAAVEAGQGPTPQELMARHPELARELAGFFADQERFSSLVAPLRPVSQAAQGGSATLAGAEATEPPSGCRATEPAATLPLGEGREPIPDRDAPTLDQPDDSGLAAIGGLDADADHARGTRIRYFGDYELRSILGRGGMGVVYKAKQLSLNRLVALKMIRTGTWADDDELRRFRNEAEAVANLDHPQIVTIHEVGQFDGQHYFSMKLIDGLSLAEHLDHYVADPRSAARLVSEVARAVHHAHQRGILHRDLKPSNIVLDPEGRPHVTDFGLAKRIEGTGSLSASGSIAGTPSYMSPEQASGRKSTVTTAADVYGLGAILYATLTGRPPFQSDSVLETLEQVRERAPERPSLINRRVDRDLETICLKCLDKDPRLRYDSAAALADDLERHLRGEPILARRAGTWERVLKWSRRRPAAAGFLVASGIAALAMVGVVVGLIDNARVRASERKAITARQVAVAAQHAEEQERKKAEAAVESEQGLRYFNSMLLAGREWKASNVRRAEQILDQDCPVRYRGWEWHYLKRQCHADLMTLTHPGYVEDVAFSPDGSRIASASDGSPLATPSDAGIRIWDVGRGTVIRSLSGHSRHDIRSVAFSPDGTLLASASGHHSQPGEVKIWDAATGQEKKSFAGSTGYFAKVVFSPDGMRLAAASGELVKGSLVTRVNEPESLRS